MRAKQLTQFSIEEPAPGYWRVVFSNPPINLMNSTAVLELGELVCRIEEAQALKVVVFASANPDFYMARYDLSDTSPIGFAPTQGLLVSPSAAARRTALIRYAAAAGPDFELRMGHHLGLIPQGMEA